MYEFETTNQGSSSYLVLRLREQDTIDELAVGMLRNNQIHGLLPMVKRWERSSYTLYYTISSLTPLSRCYAVLGVEKRLIQFLQDYCTMIKECEEYLLEPSKLLMDDDYVFVRATTGELFVPYLAVMDPDSHISTDEFFNRFIHNVENYLPPDSKIRPILYEQSFHGMFDPEKLLRSLQGLNGTVLSPQERAPRPVREPPQVVQKPVKAEVKEIYAARDGAARPPLEQPITAPAKQPEAKKKRGFLGFGGGKAEKKQAPAKGRQQAPAPQNIGFDSPFAGSGAGASVSGEQPGSFESPYGKIMPKKASPFGKKPESEKPVVDIPPLASGAPQRQSGAIQEVPPAHPRQGGGQQGGGYTINWSSLDSGVPGGTIQMPEADTGDFGQPGLGAVSSLWLVRRGDKDRVQITHSNFHVGRQRGGDEIVDYAVLTATGYLGSDHAYFQIKDGVFYLVDNNSTNGTWLNGKKLLPSKPYEIKAGDVIKMADVIFDLAEH